MEDAIKCLVENNMGLAYFVTHKWKDKTKFGFDEILSDCFMGLVKAAREFDVNRNIAFGTFAIRCMENEILMSLRKERVHHKEECFSSFVHIKEDGDEYNFVDILLIDQKQDNIDDWITNEELKSDLENAMKKLKPREKEIICAYSEGMKQRVIAKKYGYSQSYVSRIIQNSRKKLYGQMRL